MGKMDLGSAMTAKDSIQYSFQSASGVQWARSTWEVGGFDLGANLSHVRNLELGKRWGTVIRPL